MKKLFRVLWSFFGRFFINHNARFIQLSLDIIENRRLLNRIQLKQLDFERRLWALEGHTPEETLILARQHLAEYLNYPVGDHEDNERRASPSPEGPSAPRDGHGSPQGQENEKEPHSRGPEA